MFSLGFSRGKDLERPTFSLFVIVDFTYLGFKEIIFFLTQEKKLGIPIQMCKPPDASGNLLLIGTLPRRWSYRYHYRKGFMKA